MFKTVSNTYYSSGINRGRAVVDLVDMLVEEARAGIEMENIREAVSAWEKGMYIIVKLLESVFWKKLSSWEKAENLSLK